MNNNLHYFKTSIIFFLLFGNLVQQHLYAQNYSLDWAKTIGGRLWDEAESIAVDASGNVYTTGSYFHDTVDFDPGQGTYNLFSQYTSIFVSKLDASGNFQWAKGWQKRANTNFNSGNSVTIDASGDIYVTGYFTDSIIFNSPKVSDLVSNGKTDIFIIKLDSSGNVLWAKSIGASSNDRGSCVTIDKQGNVIVTGTFVGTVDFDPGIGIENLTAGSSAFRFFSFILKLDSFGNYVWAKAIGGTAGQCNSASITIDVTGDVILTGDMTKTIDFDPGPDTFNLTSISNRDIFIAKLNASGNFVWAKNIGGVGAPLYRSKSIITDASGSVYTTGSFYALGAAIDFDPGPDTFNLISNTGNTDIFISKLDSAGNFVWAKQISGGGYDEGQGITLNPSGDMLYVTGYFTGIDSTGLGNVDFDPGLDIYDLPTTSIGALAGFVLQLDTSGNFVWAGKIVDDGGFGGGNPDNMGGGKAIVVDNAGSVYTAGSFDGSGDFDPGPDTFILSSKGEPDIFIAKISRCYITDSLTTQACDSFTFNGQTFKSNGIYLDTISRLGHCDSVIALNLIVGHTFADTLTEVVCDSFTFHGKTYTSSGNYDQNISSVQCDSTITLKLTIGHTPDTAIIQTGSTLTAMAANATYQWIDCDNGNAAIPGATGQSFTPTVNGNYAVTVTSKDGCNNTSDCYTVMGISGISELKQENKIQVYPNPTNDMVTVRAEKPLHDATIRLVNVVGQIMAEQTLLTGDIFSIDINAYAPGIYMIEISEAGKTVRIKLVKE